MSALTATCPQTGKEVTTGIEVDLNSFSMLPDVPVEFLCPECGNQHRILATQARLSEKAA